MDGDIAALAEAFSRHRFAEVYPHLADDVRWDLVGGPEIVGREQVVATCEESAGELAGVATDFRRFRLVAGGDGVVVVDTEAAYRDADGDTTVVASCDVYDFVAGRLTGIRSYTVALDAQPPKAAE